MGLVDRKWAHRICPIQRLVRDTSSRLEFLVEDVQGEGLRLIERRCYGIGFPWQDSMIGEPKSRNRAYGQMREGRSSQ